MTPVPANDFWRWAAAAGVGHDPRYPASDSLGLLPPTPHHRFWVWPAHPAAADDLLLTLLDALDPWSAGFLWPRHGYWPDPGDGLRRVLTTGVTYPWDGAIRVTPTARVRVSAALLAALWYGGDTADDLYFIPDHGRQVVMASHHDVVHVECSSEERVRAVVAEMDARGYPLPTEPPDATFEWPAWMAPPATDG